MLRRLALIAVGVLMLNFPTSTARNRQYRVTVPKLDGGVNTNEALNQVADNQLTDGLNMWFKDGALRTRPGLWTGENEISGRSMSVNINDHIPEYGETTINDTRWYVLNGSVYTETDTTTYIPDYDITEYGSYYVNADSGGCFGYGILGVSGPTTMYAETNSSIASSLSNYGALMFNWLGVWGVSGAVWELLDDKYHIPLVLVNGIPSTSTSSLSVTGTLFEGFNLLTPKFKCMFTSNNSGIYYALPFKDIDDAEVVVTRTAWDGNVWQYHIAAGASQSYDTDPGGYRANIDRVGGYVWMTNAANNPYALVESGINNNVTVVAQKSDKVNKSLICGMTFNTWFGGDRSGIGGGTRLFVSGNPQHPNLVHWSDVNNPLYFPENNYAYIGGNSQKVTGFGKQGDMLVIFKEREMYYTTYVAGLPYTAEDVMSGRVTDVASNAAVFPITPINAYIGCDVPNTIQLCSNKLVWMNSDGKVYTLVSANQWSERNVRELGQNIKAKLADHGKAELLNASAADYDGHYYLLVGNKIYVLDYMDTAFQYYAGYTDDKKVQRGVSWYIWDVSLEHTTWNRIIGNIGNVILCGKQEQTVVDGEDVTTTTVLINYVFKGTVDYDVDIIGETAETKPIPCMAQTKVFDFSYPERLKDVPAAYIGIGADGNDYGIRTTYLTNHGEAHDAYTVIADEGASDYRQSSYVRERRLTPFLKRVTRFGIRFESDGAFALDNLAIVYSLYDGSVK